MRRQGWFIVALCLTALHGSEACEWPAFRGSESDGTCHGETPLGEVEDLGLKVAWRRSLGSGYSGVSVVSDQAVTLFSDGTLDVAAAFDTATGNEIWRFPIGPTYRGHDGSHDGPIATPLIAGDSVFVLGPHGGLYALDIGTGEMIWSTHLAEDQGAMQPIYGFGASPIFAGGIVVVAAGTHGDPFAKGPPGEGPSILGFDPASGKKLWQVGKDTVNYQSPMRATVIGRHLVIATTDDHLYGLEAKTGEVLWQVEHGGVRYAGPGSLSMNPVALGAGRFLLTNAPDNSTAVELAPGEDSRIGLREIWTSRSIRGSYAIPLYHDGHLYAYSKTFLTCVDAATGGSVWRSRQPGDGFPILVDGHLVVMTKGGGLHIAEAIPEGYREVASLKLFENGSWTPPSFAGGRIYARGLSGLAAVELTTDRVKITTDATRPTGTRFARFLAEVEAASDKAAIVDRFLASQKTFPMIEEADGNSTGGERETAIVHFLYRGPAQDVAIAGDMIGDRTEEPMIRVPETDLLYYTTRLLSDARISYNFIKDFEEKITDPLNTRRFPDITGEVSWVGMPRWQPPTHLDEAPAETRGRMEDFEIDGRHVNVYLPAGYDAAGERRYPVAYVHGGREAVALGGWNRTLDNVIGRTVEPLIVAFIHSQDPWQEFLFRERDSYAGAFVEAVVPAIDANYRTLATPESRASVGAGMAGYAALYSAFKHPGVIGRVASQSAFMLTMQTIFLTQHITPIEEQRLAVFIEWGTYDSRSVHESWDYREENRNLAALLKDRGYAVMVSEVSDGHGWASWRNRNDKILEWLFPLHRAGSRDTKTGE